MTSDSCCVNGKILPQVGTAPERRSITQSLGRWGGSCEALDLLKTSHKSWYSMGNPWTTGPSLRRDLGDIGEWEWSKRQCLWHISDHWTICLVGHDIQGLCLSSQGKPRIMGYKIDGLALTKDEPLEVGLVGQEILIWPGRPQYRHRLSRRLRSLSSDVRCVTPTCIGSGSGVVLHVTAEGGVNDSMILNQWFKGPFIKWSICWIPEWISRLNESCESIIQ